MGTLANSKDLDEMVQYEVFVHGLHCLLSKIKTRLKSMVHHRKYPLFI